MRMHEELQKENQQIQPKIARVEVRAHFECDRCKKTFIREHNYRTHQRVHETIDMARYQCEICLKCFTTWHCLNSHKAIHKKFICYFCEMPFNTLNRLLGHEAEHKKSRKAVSEKEPNQTEIINDLLKNLTSKRLPTTDDFEASISSAVIEKSLLNEESSDSISPSGNPITTVQSLPAQETVHDPPESEQNTSMIKVEPQPEQNDDCSNQVSDEETRSAFEPEENESDLVYVIEILQESTVVKEEPQLNEEESSSNESQQTLAKEIKEEPLSEINHSDESANFCFETITKEELIIEEETVSSNLTGSDAHLRFLDAEILNRNGVYRCIECDQFFTHYRSARSHFQKHLHQEEESLQQTVTHRAAETSHVVDIVPKEPEIPPNSSTVEENAVQSKSEAIQKSPIERPVRRSVRLGLKKNKI